jgi:hypothetical protein
MSGVHMRPAIPNVTISAGELPELAAFDRVIADRKFLCRTSSANARGRL